MAQNNFGKSFLDTFTNTMTQDQNKKVNQSAVPQPAQLSNKMGVNKKKTTQLQQNIINVIQQPQMGMMQQQGA